MAIAGPHQHGTLTVILKNENDECPICALEETNRNLLARIHALSCALENSQKAARGWMETANEFLVENERLQKEIEMLK